jgi:WD40 repeat protein
LGKSKDNNIVVWKKSSSHSHFITDIKFSPFVPHWLATTGSGLIKIWDIRYESNPVISYEAHDNMIKKLTWSKTHVEIISSGFFFFFIF